MKEKHKRSRLNFYTGAWFVGMIIMFLIVTIPIFIMFKYSISDRASIIVPPGKPIPIWPYHPTFEMYKYVAGTDEFMRVGMMSLNIALLTVCLSLVLGTPAAFALVRYRIPGRALLLILLISVRLFPDVASAVPVTETFMKYGLMNAFGVCLAHTLLSLPYIIYIAMGVFETIPKDLEEQAQILGASKFYAFTRIIIPVALPGLAAAAIYTFLLSWNEFIFAYFLLFFSESYTLPVHLIKILTWSPQHNVLATISVIISIPVIIFTFIVQKYMRAGMMAGAVK